MTLKSLFLRFLKENNAYTTTVVDKIISPSNDDINLFAYRKKLFLFISSYSIEKWIKALNTYFGVNKYYSLHKRWKSLCKKIEITNCNINIGDTITHLHGFDMTVEKIDLKSKKILCKNGNSEYFISIYAIKTVNKKKFIPFNDIEVKYKYRNKIYE